MTTKTLLTLKSPCPECGGELDLEQGTCGYQYDEPSQDPDLYCTDCDFSAELDDVDWDNIDGPRLNKEQEKRIKALRSEAYALRAILRKPENRTRVTYTDLFEHCQEGDFDWGGEPEEKGGGNPYCCGERDCEQQWHEDSQFIEIGRKDGKTWFVVMHDTITGCCDYQPIGGWDEREGDKITDEVLSDLWYNLEGRSINHFCGWAEYALHVAETGKDPLENWYSGAPSAEDAIKSADDNIGYLRRMVERLGS